MRDKGAKGKRERKLGCAKASKVSRDNCPTLKRLVMLNNVLEPCLVLLTRSLCPPLDADFFSSRKEERSLAMWMRINFVL